MTTGQTADSILNGAAILLNLVLGSFILRQQRNAVPNKLFMAIAGITAIWNLSEIVYTTTNQDPAPWANLITACTLFLPALGIHLALELTRSTKKKWMPGIYIINGSLLLPTITKKLIIPSGTGLEAGTETLILLPFYLIESITLITLIIKQAIKTGNSGETSLGIANAVLLIGGLHDILPWLKFTGYTPENFQPIGGIAAIGYGLLAGYSIAYHQTHKSFIQLNRWTAQAIRAFFLFTINIAIFTTVIILWPELFKPAGIWLTIAIMAATSLAAPLLFPNLFKPIEAFLERKIIGDKLEKHTQLINQARNTREFQEPRAMLQKTARILTSTGILKKVVIIKNDGETTQVNSQENTNATPSNTLAQKLAEYMWADANNWLTTATLNPHETNPNETSAIKALVDEQWDVAIKLSGDPQNKWMAIGAWTTKPNPQDILCLTEAAQQISQNIETNDAKYRALKAEKDEMMQRMALGVVKDLHLLATVPLQTLEKIKKGMRGRDIEDETSRSIQCLQNLVSHLHAASFFGIRQKPKLQPTNIHQLIEECVAEKEQKARSRAATLAMACDHALTAAVDKPLIRKVISAILQNAIDSTNFQKTNNIQITATTTGANLKIEVADNGTGIPENQLHRIFEPYFSTKHKAPQSTGAGLGLTTAKHIVESHHGQIRVASHWNEGTHVTIEIPQKQWPDKQNRAK